MKGPQPLKSLFTNVRKGWIRARGSQSTRVYPCNVSSTLRREALPTRWQDRWIYTTWTKAWFQMWPGGWEEVPKELDYYMTLYLSGHGDFHQYLFRIQKLQTGSCRYCVENDKAEHTIFKCERRVRSRRECFLKLGNLDKEKLGGHYAWKDGTVEPGFWTN